MSNLNEIKERHLLDRWKDAIFIGLAVLITALSLGTVTSKAHGTINTADNTWSVTVEDNNHQVIR